MERRVVVTVNPVLVVLVLLVLSCLLVYPPSPPPPHHPYSSFPMPRSLRLGSHLTDLKLTSSHSQETTIGAAMNLGRPEARMDLEVNDYPPPDHDHDHDPGHGRV
ncbi:hypothetical protein BDA96_10G040300 [Sorghum bicolor]|uniref:Uncharacterized protein n=2 Tax=Sorghum bicolor TaxID=4558 RepID=A0A194YH32_SORBI|nr:uncharacterized protein LOC110430689 [Sorghum bicolor]KAG0512742.1 hypothetical protein BDA96_10G040300 [Sorghum bicolor]KXG19282.1 hypothetical protein SORBI_3010G034900 [Sorghum bicolor]|eukprot:XP_021304171.1 uncharacterized protein LOC110430689 [Sorghum bicolor]